MYVRQKLYPNYWDNFYLEEGETFITLVKTAAGEEIHRTRIWFDTYEEARNYFENNCGG